MSDITGVGPEFDPAAERDTDQLQAEDTLDSRGLRDVLDEGYSPPERARSNHFGETPWEEAHGESIDQRLAQEEPEEWEFPDPQMPDDRRAGRLTADTDALDGRENDTYADDDGFAGGAASAEEAAVHVIDDRPRD